MSLSWSLTNLEAGVWTPEWSTDINPVQPSLFQIQQFAGGLQIFCAGPAYAGALAKGVNPLPMQLPKLTFNYTVTIDPSIQMAQVIETDTKITDAAGWTYDGSLQFNIAEGWMIQVGDPWVDTGVKLPLRIGANPVSIEYDLDFTAHTIQVQSVSQPQMLSQFLSNSAPAPIKILSFPVIPAKQMGWTPSEIVTQLQLCTGAKGGCYDLQFSSISYSGASA